MSEVDFDAGVVAWGFNWEACEKCQRFRHDEGGCEPLDLLGATILDVSVDDETITCTSFEPKAEPDAGERGRDDNPDNA